MHLCINKNNMKRTGLNTKEKYIKPVTVRHTQLCYKQELQQQQSVTTFYQQPKLWPRENGRDKWQKDSNFLHDEENRN